MTNDIPAPPPAFGGWRPGDPPGRRQFVTLYTPDAPLQLEAGGTLPSVTVAYETWGELNDDRSNAVLVLHALTGDSHAAGPPGPGHRYTGWWDGSIGPGKWIDTDRWFVVCPNVLGGCQGTTGPSSTAPDGRPYGSRWPRTTIRDQVAVEAAFADALGIDRWVGVVGGSMGGMRALEWAATYPERVGVSVAVAVGAAATAEQIGLCSMQVEAIKADPGYRGGDYYDAGDGQGPHRGMGIARRIGHLSYRSEVELQARFGRDSQEDGVDPLTGGLFAVESYFDHHADKLCRRFDANTYIALSEAMNFHDIGRGRGGVEKVLSAMTVPVFAAGVSSDRLYPLYLQEQIAALVPGAPPVTVIESLYGHDSFLIEAETVGRFVSEALAYAGPVGGGQEPRRGGAGAVPRPG